jgi:hypothetical protein
MKKFSLLNKLVVVILAFALAGMASAQLSLSGAIYSEEKTNFEAPQNFQMIIYALDRRDFIGSYNANSGIEPTIIRGVDLDIMLVNFNVNLKEVALKFVHPALLADQEQLKRLTNSEEGWAVGKRSDTAYLFSAHTSDLPPGHSVAVLRCKANTRTRHSFLVIIRWVSTGTERKDQGFTLMAQDLPPSAGQIPMSDLMQMGLFSGFRSRWATLPQDPMRTINQVIPGQSSTAGSQQTQGNNVLPPDLDLPGSGSSNTNNLLAQQGGTGLPPDLPLTQTKKLPDFSIRFSNERLGREVGKLANGELDEAMRVAHSGNTVAISKAQATIYVWSDEFFEGEIRCGDNSVKLAVYRHSNGKYWARLCGSTNVLPDSKLVLKAGLNTRTIAFTPEVN